MTDNVVYLHGAPPREVALVTRVGFFEHRQCEHLLDSNKLPPRRFVIEAANAVDRQAGLLRTLRDASAEIVLDTNAAELSVPGSFLGAVRSAPWAADGRMLEPGDFVAGTNRSVIEPIARFAVAKGMTAVMAPTHYPGDDNNDWLSVDIKACEALRLALDREGGEHIAVDYPVILTYRQLRDPALRQRILTALHELPFDFLWLRVSGFGIDATGVGISRFIEAVRPLGDLGKPIIADQLGGLAGLAASAFGAVSGFAHGIESKQRFDAGDWHKLNAKSGGGRPKKIYIPGLDRWMEVTEARQMFDDSKTTRQIFGCPDPTCCGDIDRMLRNPEAHFMVQRQRAVEALSSIPESARVEGFLYEHLERRMKDAQRATRLKKLGDETRKKVAEAAKRLERFSDSLSGLYKREGQPDFAPEARLRSATPGRAHSSRSSRP